MTTLSGYQYALLTKLAKLGAISEENAAKYNQTTFGSFITRKYLTWNAHQQALIITETALDALQAFRQADILRRIESSRLHVRFYRSTGRKAIGGRKPKTIRAGAGAGRLHRVA